MEVEQNGKQSAGGGILAWIERVGNRLPDPITLFVILAALVILISWICSLFGVSAVHPGTGKTMTVINLLSKDGFRQIWSKAVTNFSGFAPMGIVLVAVIGTGVAEKSGFLSALMQKLLSGVPPILVTLILVFICVNGNVAGDSAFVIMPPLAAATYLSMGRNPMVGMFTAFASVAAGFCATVVLALTDTMAYGFTESAARLLNPDYAASPAINYYFLVVSCLILTVVGTLVSELLIAPRYAHVDLAKYGKNEQKALTPEQAKGIKYALRGLAVTVVVIALMCVGSDPLMGDPEQGGSITSPSAPFMSGLVVTVGVLFFVPGAIYGFVSGKYKNDKEMFADITLAFKDMAPYIVLCFFCAQFTNYFGWSNLGVIIAVKGAELLKALNFTGIPLLVGVIFASCVINLFIGSASAKWAILAPVFVPMLLLLNLDPAVTQIAYRIGDSITNPLSPLFYYFPVILGFAHRYEKDTGMGTVIANMVPFSFCFTIVWVLQLVVWVLMDLPLGPGGRIFL
ncbi:MAG: AbgT family transporter [Synergistaceae bacterium]|jgi:aminobenzoyl-glutamate transport protein|nr:AbgT family transporter [Synergistaceae bacterium]